MNAAPLGVCQKEMKQKAIRETSGSEIEDRLKSVSIRLRESANEMADRVSRICNPIDTTKNEKAGQPIRPMPDYFSVINNSIDSIELSIESLDELRRSVDL